MNETSGKEACRDEAGWEESGWEESLYNKTYNDELRAIENRILHTKCAKADLESTLKSLYITEGSDWIGRGKVQDLTMRATIAAYETAIGGWELGAGA